LSRKVGEEADITDSAAYVETSRQICIG